MAVALVVEQLGMLVLEGAFHQLTVVMQQLDIQDTCHPTGVTLPYFSSESHHNLYELTLPVGSLYVLQHQLAITIVRLHLG